MRGLVLILAGLTTAFGFQENRLRTVENVAVVEANEEPSILSRLLGAETQARVIDSISSWANDKAKENPGCVERFVCETYRSAEGMSGIPYLFMSLTNAAVSFIVAEQFEEAIEMEAITRAARYGRTTGTCHRMECPMLDGQLRTVADYLSGVEEILGYIVNSVSTSIG